MDAFFNTMLFQYISESIEETRRQVNAAAAAAASQGGQSDSNNAVQLLEILGEGAVSVLVCVHTCQKSILTAALPYLMFYKYL